MDKNFNLENAKNVIAAHSDIPVNTTLGGVTKPIDLLFEVIDMNADLIALIREEAELKKHHRAYLHVRAELEDCTDWTSSRMLDILDEARDCLDKRNRYMVDHANFILAVWNGKPSGTGRTVTYAREKQRAVIVIDPVSLTVNRL